MPAKLLPFHDPRKKPEPTPPPVPVDMGAISIKIGKERYSVKLSASIEREAPEVPPSPPGDPGAIFGPLV